MRQPPSPLLLSARKRRPRRNPPQGRQVGAPAQAEGGTPQHPQEQPAQATPEEPCALLQRDPNDAGRGVSRDDDNPPSSR